MEEPTDDVAVAMVRGLSPTLEAHHKIEILDEAIHESVRLSRRYMSGRQLPDKSVSLLDTACAGGAGTNRNSSGHRRLPEIRRSDLNGD